MNPKITRNAIAVVAMSFLWSMCAYGQACPEHQAFLDKMDEIFEARQVDRLAEVYQADAVIHGPEGTVEGLDKIIAANKEFFTDVPDAKGENVDVFCSGNKIAVRWKGQGTMNGKKVKVWGNTIYHLRDGKIAEVWEAMDMLGLMKQMGHELTPPPGANN